MQLTGRDTLDTATTSETTNSGLSDTLDVVTENLPVTLGTTLSETLSALATWKRLVSLMFYVRHDMVQQVEWGTLGDRDVDLESGASGKRVGVEPINTTRLPAQLIQERDSEGVAEGGDEDIGK